ncbi:LamG domain-containing protein [Methylomonas rosea]|uniref:LamG domain-containing protein n=1 Tax=Methylomonas rosea TaxID=2952227 RepID=A0ABT1TSK3_9GAMM|nr:LamG domain-containing protein [Methylomonas sp. WSC-7]MCQ8117763.1 LamG domain-containing protein [Methylomonas sp. WSC-7]
MKDFRNSERDGGVSAFLAHCDSTGASCIQIASSAINRSPWATTGSWVQKTATFTIPSSFTIPAGRYLALKLIVNNTSDDDMWFAYDTTSYPSRLEGLVPVVTGIDRVSASPTTAGSNVSWSVTFDKGVTGVDTTDFSLVPSGGVTGASISSVIGSGTSWTVTANTGLGSGSLGLNLVDNDTIKDSTNTVLGGSGSGNGNFTGQVYTVPSTLLPQLDFYMDEASWNGTANEVIDSGSGYHGTAATLAGSKPSTANTLPARAGSPGTCGYGVFNRTNKNYVALSSSFPNLGATGDAFTIAAWIKTTNNTSPNQRIFIDDENNSGGYGFSLADGGTGKVRFFTRGTPSALSLDTANVIANNTWYFVAAVADVPNKIKRIYVFNTAGTLLANVSMTWTETSFGSDSGIASIGGETNAAGENNNNFGFAGNIDELRIFQNALSQTDIQTLMSRTRSCTVVSPVLLNPVDFNCVEAGQSELTGHIYGKLAGTPFALDVVALKDGNSDGIAEGALTTYASDVTRNVTVELVDGSGSTACRYRSALSPAISQTLSFTKASQPSEQGRKSSAGFTVAKAYANLRCRVTDATNSPSVVGCSADSFSVRPAAFNVSASADGSSAIKTGTSFTMTAASGVVGYDGSPKLDPSKLNAHSGAVRSGTLTGTFDYADHATGTARGTDFIYSEVGYFNLSAQGVYDDNFTEVDAVNNDCANSFANTVVGGKFGCKFGNTATTSNFGRFIPDHFDVTLNTPLFAPACGSFSYVGQPIKYTTNPVATISAKNADDVTTQNYTGSYWKISPSHATYGITPSYSEAGNALTVLNSSSPVATDTGNGSGTLTFADTSSNILGVTRGNPLAPFNAEIAMSFSLQDTDAVQVAHINGVAGNNPVKFGAASAGNGIAFSGGNKTQRWGRLTLSNAHGSELTALPMPLFSEYFNGTAFVTNTADNCTNLSLSSQIKLSNAATSNGALKAGNTAMTILPSGTSSATLANTPLLAGIAGLSFSAPGAGNTGYIDVSADLSSLPWLLFDWDHDGGHDDAPTAKATFGIYKGNSRQIYLREVY